MRVHELISVIDARYPFRNAAEWDPVGLQIGDADADIGLVGVCHEVTDTIVTMATDAAIGTLVTYHPLLFTPSTSLRAGPTPQGRALALARTGVSVVVVHTALDAATPGTGDAFLGALGLSTHERLSIEGETDECAIGRIALANTLMPIAEVVEAVRVAAGGPIRTTPGPESITSIAVIPGSGGSAIEAVIGRAEVLVTGDVSHHKARLAVSHGLMVVDAGHIGSERAGVQAMYSAVAEDVHGAVFLDDDPTPWEG